MQEEEASDVTVASGGMALLKNSSVAGVGLSDKAWG